MFLVKLICRKYWKIIKTFYFTGKRRIKLKKYHNKKQDSIIFLINGKPFFNDINTNVYSNNLCCMIEKFNTNQEAFNINFI